MELRAFHMSPKGTCQKVLQTDIRKKLLLVGQFTVFLQGLYNVSADEER